MASATPITARWLVDHLPDRSGRAHKGTFGSVLVVAGSFSYPGAALLSGLGAMRAGAGLVEVAIGESIVGHQPAGQRRARQLIEAVRRPCVVDADGLNALATVPRWWEGVRGSLVLTPHPGEFARLTGAAILDPDDDDARA